MTKNVTAAELIDIKTLILVLNSYIRTLKAIMGPKKRGQMMAPFFGLIIAFKVLILVVYALHIITFIYLQIS